MYHCHGVFPPFLKCVSEASLGLILRSRPSSLWDYHMGNNITDVQ